HVIRYGDAAVDSKRGAQRRVLHVTGVDAVTALKGDAGEIAIGYRRLIVIGVDNRAGGEVVRSDGIDAHEYKVHDVVAGDDLAGVGAGEGIRGPASKQIVVLVDIQDLIVIGFIVQSQRGGAIADDRDLPDRIEVRLWIANIHRGEILYGDVAGV